MESRRARRRGIAALVALIAIGLLIGDWATYEFGSAGSSNHAKTRPTASISTSTSAPAIAASGEPVLDAGPRDSAINHPGFTDVLQSGCGSDNPTAARSNVCHDSGNDNNSTSGDDNSTSGDDDNSTSGDDDDNSTSGDVDNRTSGDDDDHNHGDGVRY